MAENVIAAVDEFDDLDTKDVVVTERKKETEVKQPKEEEPKAEEQEEQEEETEETKTEEETVEQERESEDENEEETEEDSQEYDEKLSEYYNQLSDEVGLEIDSEDKLVGALAHYRELLDKNPIEDLPKEAQMVIKTIQEGGDYMKRLQLLTLDENKMSEKDVLRQSYILNSTENSSEDEKLLELEFNREYKLKYSILDKLNSIQDEFEKKYFEDENREEIELAKLTLQRDIKKAKEAISKFKKENSSPKSKVDELTEEERENILEKHTKSVEDITSKFKGVHIPINDREDDDFILGVSEEDRQLLKDTLLDPREYLTEVVGYNPFTGELDYQKLATNFLIHQNQSKLGSLLAKYYNEKEDRKTVEEIVNKQPKKVQSGSRKGDAKGIVVEAPDDFS